MLAPTSVAAVLTRAEQPVEARAKGIQAPQPVDSEPIERATASREERRQAVWRPPSAEFW